jgi:hypothetical protein
LEEAEESPWDDTPEEMVVVERAHGENGETGPRNEDSEKAERVFWEASGTEKEQPA